MTKPRKPTIPTDLLVLPGAAPTRGTAIEDLPRPATAAPAARSGGLKANTVGTTLYLLPTEAKRVKRLAIDLDVSVHELVMMGLDRILAEDGQPPIERYRGAGR